MIQSYLLKIEMKIDQNTKIYNIFFHIENTYFEFKLNLVIQNHYPKNKEKLFTPIYIHTKIARAFLFFVRFAFVVTYSIHYHSLFHRFHFQVNLFRCC